MRAPAATSLSSSARDAAPLLLPREHGAYGQFLFPIATALVLGNRGLSAVALTVATSAVFVAHEAVLVLLGQRGGRAARQHWRAALAWLAACALIAAATGGVALARMP